MRNAGGYSIITDPSLGKPIEQDTFTCAHCSAITFTREGLTKPLQVAVIHTDGTVSMKNATMCRKCFRHICPRCENNFACTPIEKRLDDEEKAWRKGIILP